MSADKVVKIVICQQCAGTGGTIRYARMEERKQGSDGIIHSVCDKCKGSGRMQQTITIVTEPYEEKNVNVHDGVYDCDPVKNKACNMSGCYLSGGSCSQTTHKEFSVREDE